MLMTQEDVRKLLEISVMLSSERDIRRLLNRILGCVMEITRCDAGTLYLLDGDVLRFEVSRNNTLKNFAGEDAAPDLPPVPLTRESVCALSLLEDKTIRADDVRDSTEYDFTGPIKYDAMTGYYTKSMLVTPMRNREGEAIGVLQLINAMDERGEICPFSQEMILLVEGVSSQAALAIQNVRYIQEIKGLFQSFVKVMSTAVDERTPYNASHTRHMAIYGARFLDFLNARARAAGEPEPYPPARREELLMSVWLHDIGKLTTPLEVMNKEARLLPAQHAAFLHRMELVRLHARIDCLSGAITEQVRAELEQATRDAIDLVEACNTAGFLPDEKLDAIAALAVRTYTSEDGAVKPWLEPEELAMLSIRKGTLSDAERQIMEEHVVITDKLLSQITFSKELSHVRQWASGHHEYLSGDGYPKHLRGDQVPEEVRIITILDIFDALTADDRPYKPGMPVEKALGILDAMAGKEGKLDVTLTKLFTESRCWEETTDPATT